MKFFDFTLVWRNFPIQKFRWRFSSVKYIYLSEILSVNWIEIFGLASCYGDTTVWTIYFSSMLLRTLCWRNIMCRQAPRWFAALGDIYCRYPSFKKYPAQCYTVVFQVSTTIRLLRTVFFDHNRHSLNKDWFYTVLPWQFCTYSFCRQLILNIFEVLCLHILQSYLSLDCGTTLLEFASQTLVLYFSLSPYFTLFYSISSNLN